VSGPVGVEAGQTSDPPPEVLELPPGVPDDPPDVPELPPDTPDDPPDVPELPPEVPDDPPDVPELPPEVPDDPPSPDAPARARTPAMPILMPMMMGSTIRCHLVFSCTDRQLISLSIFLYWLLRQVSERECPSGVAFDRGPVDRRRNRTFPGSDVQPEDFGVGEGDTDVGVDVPCLGVELPAEHFHRGDVATGVLPSVGVDRL